METHKILIDFFRPYVGQKITKQDDSLMKKVKDALPELPDCYASYPDTSTYNLRWQVRVCVSNSEIEPGSCGCAYEDVYVYLGKFQNGDGVLTELDESPEETNRRTDYNYEELEAARAEVKRLEDELDKAKRKCYPFDPK